MASYAFRIVNVFTTSAAERLSGNPLCVFEDARGLTDAQLQALARQLNLSETTFILPPTRADATARVRIFTPGFEMPFAGHPTLGTAHVVRALRGGDHQALEMKAGLVPVSFASAPAAGDTWTLRAARAPVTREPEGTTAELAAMLGLPPTAIAGPPLWVDTGVEQLVIPLDSVDAVRAARPDPALITRWGFSAARDEAMAYVWARDTAESAVVRFFFTSHGAVIEDPATGSACANLGGWLLATGAPLPAELTLRQGDAVGRPSRLGLRVGADRSIHVTGGVIELARGTLDL
jgi:PhzF family phenazine biosynthesis protein